MNSFVKTHITVVKESNFLLDVVDLPLKYMQPPGLPSDSVAPPVGWHTLQPSLTKLPEWQGEHPAPPDQADTMFKEEYYSRFTSNFSKMCSTNLTHRLKKLLHKSNILCEKLRHATVIEKKTSDGWSVSKSYAIEIPIRCYRNLESFPTAE